jgi:hypothetical protein
MKQTTAQDEKTFKITFIGRKVGAIGKRYQITETVKATDQQAAELRLYDNYEHIAVLGCRVSKK